MSDDDFEFENMETRANRKSDASDAAGRRKSSKLERFQVLDVLGALEKGKRFVDVNFR
jgi:hypothetical protein